MRYRYKITRPIARMVEGQYDNAFIVWDRRACLWNTRHIAKRPINNGELVSLEQDYTEETYVVQYEYFFGINLWFIVMDWNFKGRES